MFHPKGGIIRRDLEDYSRRKHEDAGYEFVNTPHITKAQLFETSGHLEWYADGMYPPMHIDSETDAEGNIRRAGANYYLKPMNCPFHNLIFRSRGRSYRELPLRMFEFGSVYRYEKSGVVHGLTRVRGMTQDDAHIYCTRDQMRDELTSLLQFVLDLLADYGLDDFYLELSTKNPDKFVGDDALWEEATSTLAEVAAGLRADPGARPGRRGVLRPEDLGADPRRDRSHLADVDHPAGLQPARALRAGVPGRRRHAGAPGDDPSRTVRLGRAVHGCAHRALRRGLPGLAGAGAGGRYPDHRAARASTLNDVAAAAAGRWRARRGGLQRRPDAEEDPHHTKQKVPFMLIAGDDDMTAGAVSFRYRSGEQRNGVPIEEAVAEVVAAIAEHRQV